MELEDEVERLRREVKELRSVCNDHPELYTRFYFDEALKTLKQSILFSKIDDSMLQEIARRCTRSVYPAGTVLAKEGQPWTQKVKFFATGEVSKWTGQSGIHTKVKSLDNASVGTMHFLLDEPTRFNVVCETEVVCYEISKEDFDNLINRHPKIMLPIAQALAAYIRTEHRQITAGLFEQRGIIQKHEKTAYTATALAVFVEAFYRSAMNVVLNTQLAGKPIPPPTEWFPQMHIQAPTRILYITGLKEIRRMCNDIDFRENKFVSPTTGTLLLSFLPGLAMCPLSSVLEATHSQGNKEPMHIRCTRGYAPRMIREVLFGIGINQLSDYCREYVPAGVTNQPLRIATGSIVSGILSGYLSQIPHNLSTMKLLDPSQSYRKLWKTLYARSEHRIPKWIAEPVTRDLCTQATALFFPLGCFWRSIQIGGSFIIINGLLYQWRDKEWG